MKYIILFFPVLILSFENRIGAQNNFSYIDQTVRSMHASTPDSLAQLLTKDLITETEKARAIFSWIAQNISYNTGVFSFVRNQKAQPVLQDDEDGRVNWSSGNEMTAIRVMKKKLAICDGYAKLFQTLCEYAGLRSEIVLGFARSGYEKESRFRTNHSWNAIMIDGKWQLVDVTWGSGYVNMGNQFVQQIDDRYFLTEPGKFFLDHYPEDLQWTLLNEIPAMYEYTRTPYRLKSFIKYNIKEHYPSRGIIEASAGDTIRVAIELKDAVKAFGISSDPFFDSSIMYRDPDALYVTLDTRKGNIVSGLVVAREDLQWLYFMFNGDAILRYRVKVRKDISMK